MCARAARCVAVIQAYCGDSNSAHSLAKKLTIGFADDGALRFVQRAHVAEQSDGRFLAGDDALAQLQPELQQPLYARRRIGFLSGGFDQRFDTGDGVEETRDRQVFLLAEVIGDAGRDQADAARDVGERHAFDAVAIQDFAGGGDDRLLFARVFAIDLSPICRTAGAAPAV